MSFEAIKWALATRGLKASEKLLLVVLADHANEGGTCFPSAKLLTEETSLNKDTVFKALKSLEEQGLVTKSKGGRNSNLYTLAVGAVIRKTGYPEKQISEKPDIRKTGHELSEKPDSSYPKNRTLISKESINEPTTAETFQDPPATADPAASELFPENPAPQPKARKRAALESFPQDLPEEWMRSAKEARPDIDPAYVFGKLKARYAGTATKKALATWRREFMNWIGREFARPQNNSNKPSSWIRNDQSTMDYSEDSVRKFLGCA